MLAFLGPPFSPEKRKKEPKPLGLSLPYVGPVFDPGWRILSRCWAHVDVFWVYMGPMLGVSGPNLVMLAVCWPYVGFSWPSYCEAPFSPKKRKRSPGLWALACPMLGPCWRIFGLCWAHVVIFWVYVGPMLGVFGPKLAMLALSWPYVGFTLALILWGSFFRKKRNPGLWVLRGSFSIFTPRAMSSQLRCTCQLSGRGASAMPL